MVTPGLHVWPALYLSCYSVIFRQSQTTTSLLGVSQRGKNSTNLDQFHGRLWFKFISVSGSVNIYQYKIWFSDKILEIIISWTPTLATLMADAENKEASLLDKEILRDRSKVRREKSFVPEISLTVRFRARFIFNTRNI